jgi:hypothetical protein
MVGAVDDAVRPGEPAAMDDEIQTFLAAHSRAFLLTRRRDGAPTIHPMTGLLADGRLVFNTYRKSAKARNIERDPRAAVVVVNGYGAPRVEAVGVRGRGSIRTAAAMPAAAPTSAAPRVSGSVAGRVTERMASGKRILIDVAPGVVEWLSPIEER